MAESDVEACIDEVLEHNARLIGLAWEKAAEFNRKYPGSCLTWRDMAIPGEFKRADIFITGPTQDRTQPLAK